MFTVSLPSPRAKPKYRKTDAEDNYGSAIWLHGTAYSSRRCVVGVLTPNCVEVTEGFKTDIFYKGCFGQRISKKARPPPSEELQTESTFEDIQEIPAEDELMILSFEEAFFLCYALGCLVVKDGENVLNVEQLWEKLTQVKTVSNSFPIMYAAYHHFRSKGWVVKPGMKFGSHYVLYQDGMNKNHATYSVRVMSGEDSRLAPSWTQLAALNRATVNAGKDNLLCYVLVPQNVEDFQLPTCITQFQIQELLVNRWVGAQERADHQD